MSNITNYGSIVSYPQSQSRNNLYIFGNSPDNKIIYSNNYLAHENRCSDLKEVPNAYNSNQKPAVVVFKNRLHLAWTNR